MTKLKKRIRHTETTQRYKYCSDHGKGRPEHDVVWERANGRSLPAGYVIHHIDGNGLNNDINNLMLLTKAQHAALHNQLRRDGKDPVDPTDPRVIKTREASRIAGKKYRESHKELISERGRKYREEHHDEIIARSRAYDASHKEQKRAYELAHKDHIQEVKRNYREAHREALCAADRARYAEKKEVILAQAKIRYDAKRDSILAQKREYHAKNRDIINMKDRQYRQDHLEEMRARDRARAERTGELRNARQRLSKAIKNNWSQEIIDSRRKEVDDIRNRLIAEGKLDPKFSNRK